MSRAVVVTVEAGHASAVVFPLRCSAFFPFYVVYAARCRASAAANAFCCVNMEVLVGDKKIVEYRA